MYWLSRTECEIRFCLWLYWQSVSYKTSLCTTDTLNINLNPYVQITRSNTSYPLFINPSAFPRILFSLCNSLFSVAKHITVCSSIALNCISHSAFIKLLYKTSVNDIFGDFNYHRAPLVSISSSSFTTSIS